MSARIALALSLADAMAQAFADALDGGALVLYSDTTAAPATPEDAVPGGAVELARFALPGTAAGTVLDGVVTVAALGPIPWLATARVGWARVERTGGAGLLVPNVGIEDEALTLTSMEAVEGQDVTVVEWAFAVPVLVDESVTP